MTPVAEDGISIEALSDSTVISDCSVFTLSPTLTSTSITATSLKSPISGTRTSTGPVALALPGAAAGATGCATGLIAVCADAVWAGALFDSDTWAADGPAALPASSTSTTEPCLTLSPSLTLISLTTPAWLDGISIEALSDSTVISDCSACTVSPGLTRSSMTETSSKSPMSGILMSTNAIFFFPILPKDPYRAVWSARAGQA